MSASLSVSALIAAPAETLYPLIADYREGHPRIVPQPPFTGIEVEEGGYGAGTRILVRVRVMGKNDFYRSVISEPVPGRVLVETNDNGFVSTFTLEPQVEGQQTRVTISSVIAGKPAWRAALEMWLFSGMMRGWFRAELKLLGEAAGGAAVQLLD